MKAVAIVYDDLEKRYLWWVTDGPDALTEGGSKDINEAFEEARDALKVVT